MRMLLQRLAALVAVTLLGAAGLTMAATWSPTSVGLVAPASADDDGGDEDDDDGGQVPAGGVATGQGGIASPDQDDDGGADDDGGQVPAGGVATGQGGVAESWAGEPASNDRSDGVADVVGTVAPVAAVGLGSLLVGRLAWARLRGTQG